MLSNTGLLIDQPDLVWSQVVDPVQNTEPGKRHRRRLGLELSGFGMALVWLEGV